MQYLFCSNFLQINKYFYLAYLKLIKFFCHSFLNYLIDLNNPLFEYLSSDPDDTFYEARFKNALEGAGLGGALEGTFRAFRWYKNKKAQANNEKFNKKQLEEDEKALSSIKEEEIVLNKYKPLPEKLETEVVKNLEKDLEDSIFLGFKDAQKNTKNVGDFNKAIELDPIYV